MQPPRNRSFPRHDPLTSARGTVASGGRFVLGGDTIEHRCQTVDISGAGVALRASIQGRVGEHVICYLDDIGRVEGRVARVLDDGFAVEFTGPASKRARIAQQIAGGGPAADPAQAKRSERIEPTVRRVVLRGPDGRHIACQIINISQTGAALTCPVLLPVGAAVTVGRRPASVMRAAQRLLAVQFDTPLAEDELTVDIVL